MRSDPHQDPSVLEVKRKTENTASAGGDPPDIDYLDVQVEYEDETIILTPKSGLSDADPYRISTNRETIQTLSSWFRTVTHQVLRFARSKGRKDHISFRRKTICNYKVHTGTRDPPFGVVTPTSEDQNPYRWYIPLDRLHNGALTRRGVCSDCKSRLKTLGFGGGLLNSYRYRSEAIPTCPNCGNDVVAIENRDLGASIAKHEETDDLGDPDQCDLSWRDIKEIYADGLGVPVEAKSRYSENQPHDYITDFPEVVTDNTGGLKAEYCQPAQKNSTKRGKKPDSFAGLFELSHPKFEHICVFRYSHWGRTNVYEPAVQSITE